MIKPRRNHTLMGGKRAHCSFGQLLAASTVLLFCTYMVLLSGTYPSSLIQLDEQDQHHHRLSKSKDWIGSTTKVRSLSVSVGTGGTYPAVHHEVRVAAPTAGTQSNVVSSPEQSLVEGKTPYYLTGRTGAKKYSSHEHYNELKLFTSIKESPIKNIPDSQNNWVLKSKLPNSTRNHDNVIFDVESSGRHVLVAVLGRYSETIQWIDLMTGKQSYKEVHGLDPAGNPLNSLNHVYSVVVDSITTPSHKEIWLPCGFHGHDVNREWSSEYARIVNLKTMEVTTGPKLPYAGGACAALPLHIKGPDEPAHICVFGGTHGEHDKGTFLPYTSCYDREEQKWNHPFGRLPFGLDHGNALHLPAGICDPADPERILISNFRTEPYGTPHSEILAVDIPSSPWTDEQLASTGPETPGKWYLYANISYTGLDDEVNAPRDASGTVFANNWRSIINFGGVHYHAQRHVIGRRGGKVLVKSKRKYSMVRKFDICNKTFSEVGRLGMETFALQSSASGKLNIAITCGGHSRTRNHENSPWCLVNRIPGVQFQTDRGCTAKTDDEIAGAILD
eukprot:scaffold1_cov108-Cylindrotheca_fusiformis.AAC.5